MAAGAHAVAPGVRQGAAVEKLLAALTVVVAGAKPAAQ
jgi:hypothetical protein